MATVNDIDTQALVSKFLQRQIITPTTADEEDGAEEIQAVLETIATSFLITPQAAMPLILRAKNSLQQLVVSDIAILDFLIGAIVDIRNPDIPIKDTSDLIEAQTALVELDRLGRVGEELQAFQRYKKAINRFLDDELGVFLKRNARKVFERSGNEAKEDIFTAFPQFSATHGVMAERLAALHSSVTDFRTSGLNKLVSTRTVQEVRTSLREIKNLVDQDDLSKTVTAIELMAGVASLESISENLDIYDPTISTADGLPPSRVISIRPEQIGATALSSEGPWDASGSDVIFSLKVNPFSPAPVSLTPTIPDTDVEDVGGDAAVYVSSSASNAAATYEIPANGTLYVQIVTGVITELEISITSGTRTTVQILNDINAGLTDATAIDFKGADRFLIYGTAVAVTSIVVRAGSSGASGVLTTDPSVHDVLGFDINQASLAKGFFDAASLEDALSGRLPGVTLAVEGEKLRIISDLTDPTVSSLEFDTTVSLDVQGVFGFSGTVEAQPSYMELVEDSAALPPEIEGVFVGSAITAVELIIAGSAVRSLNNESVTAIEGTKISFAQSVLPRGGELGVEATSPDVLAVQSLIQVLTDFVGTFDDDAQDLQFILSPTLSSPSQAQVNDAIRALNKIRDRLTGASGLLEALEAIVVRLDRSPFAAQADVIIKSLEERGMDRAADLLLTGKFSEFFALTKNTSSRASQLLNSMELFISQDVPVSFEEELIDDDVGSRGTNPDFDVLDAVEPGNLDDGLVDDP